MKLGSNVVANGDGEPRMDVLERVCDVLAGLHREGGEAIIVTSGAIARGVRVMNLPERPSSIGGLQAASAVGQTTATLNASVNPRGGALSACKLEYGKTTAYGSSAPCTTLPGSGSSPVAVSALLTTGLIANTEYHFRISATNAAGTSKGADVTFKTS